jgi:hypothetical protein
MSVHSDRLPPETTAGLSHRRILLFALGGVLLWTALVLASQVLWHQVFGFSAGASWALAVGLSIKIGVLALVMLAAILADKRER